MAVTLCYRNHMGELQRLRTETPVQRARGLLVAGLRLVWFEVHGRTFPVHPEESMRRVIVRLEREHAQGVLL